MAAARPGAGRRPAGPDQPPAPRERGRAPGRSDPAPGDPHRRRRQGHGRPGPDPRRDRPPPARPDAAAEGRDDPRDPSPREEQPADGGQPAAHPGPPADLRGGQGGARRERAADPFDRRSCTRRSRRTRATRWTSTGSRSGWCAWSRRGWPVPASRITLEGSLGRDPGRGGDADVGGARRAPAEQRGPRLRRARTGTVAVRLTRWDGEATVEVADDGDGPARAGSRWRTQTGLGPVDRPGPGRGRPRRPDLRWRPTAATRVRLTVPLATRAPSGRDRYGRRATIAGRAGRSRRPAPSAEPPPAGGIGLVGDAHGRVERVGRRTLRRHAQPATASRRARGLPLAGPAERAALVLGGRRPTRRRPGPWRSPTRGIRRGPRSACRRRGPVRSGRRRVRWCRWGRTARGPRPCIEPGVPSPSAMPSVRTTGS